MFSYEQQCRKVPKKQCRTVHETVCNGGGRGGHGHRYAFPTWTNSTFIYLQTLSLKLFLSIFFISQNRMINQKGDLN